MCGRLEGEGRTRGFCGRRRQRRKERERKKGEERGVRRGRRVGYMARAVKEEGIRERRRRRRENGWWIYVMFR